MPDRLLSGFVSTPDKPSARFAPHSSRHSASPECGPSALGKRAEAEVETPIATQADMAEAARETLARHRQQEEQVQEAMLKRSESEVGLDQSI